MLLEDRAPLDEFCEVLLVVRIDARQIDIEISVRQHAIVVECAFLNARVIALPRVEISHARTVRREGAIVRAVRMMWH